MPTGEYIKTSNRFEPLSSLIDLTSGNSFNEKIKHTDLKEVKRRIKLLLDKSTSTKLLNAHALNLTFRTSDSRIHPIEMQTRSTPGKISQRKNPKIVVVADSFAKGIVG